jgi:hypothetical protein
LIVREIPLCLTPLCQPNPFAANFMRGAKILKAVTLLKKEAEKRF